jgi:hypothetical protein
MQGGRYGRRGPGVGHTFLQGLQLLGKLGLAVQFAADQVHLSFVQSIEGVGHLHRFLKLVKHLLLHHAELAGQGQEKDLNHLVISVGRPGGADITFFPLGFARATGTADSRESNW